MTVEVAEQQQEEMASHSQDGKPVNQSDYGCQILLEKTSIEAANDKSFPTDARLIWYIVDGVEYVDLTRCGKVSKMFDMYYDKFKKGLKKIDYGYGTVKPNLWGYQSAQGPKKKKRK